ncbi:cupin domain-containing protein [Campylobacter sp. RM15925]|uniref:cupin domain-containing protein n=1 Tax=Campylobacter sp. RM15925 TaxID=1705724 RepID=UPI00147292A5|nr:cupin domain-containing protein [Campylobacter sp. RM15925]
MQKIVWKDENFNGIKVVKLFEGSGSKEIRINLQKGHEMKEHQAPGAIMVQVLSGKIEFSVGSDVQILNSLDMIALDANIPHALNALEDSIVRLSLSKNDDVSRVFKVLNA